MTTKQYIIAFLEQFVLSDSKIDLIIFENDLDPNSQADKLACKTAIWNSLSSWALVTQITEGGFSVSLNEEQYNQWYADLSREIGRTDVSSGFIRLS